MSYKKWIKQLKTIVWIAALIFCVERGWIVYFLIGSVTLSCILYRKQLWQMIWVGGNLYADTSMSLSDKMISKLSDINKYIRERTEVVRQSSKELKKKKK